jgi:hypothetical protein
VTWLNFFLSFIFLSLFLSFLVWPLNATHWRFRGLLSHPITLNDTHTHTHKHTSQDSHSRGIGLSQITLPDNTDNSQRTDTNTAGEIRTYSSRKREVADLHPTPTAIGIGWSQLSHDNCHERVVSHFESHKILLKDSMDILQNIYGRYTKYP